MLLPVVVAALPAVWRAGPRFVAAAIVVGAGSSALATILFTQAFVDGDPVTPVVLQKVQPLVAVSLAAVMLGERPRPRFGLFLLGGLAGTWLMAFPSPFDVSLHGQAPVLYALMAAALWALGTVLGRFLALELPFQQVTALRFAFGLPAALAAVLVLGAPLRASLHDELFIALLALVTGLVAILLYYYGLQRTTASVASLAELAFPVVAIAVGYFAFDATLTSTQLAGVVLTSLVVLLLPRRGPALVAERAPQPVPAESPALVSARPGRGARSRVSSCSSEWYGAGPKRRRRPRLSVTTPSSSSRRLSSSARSDSKAMNPPNALERRLAVARDVREAELVEALGEQRRLVQVALPQALRGQTLLVEEVEHARGAVVARRVVRRAGDSACSRADTASRRDRASACSSSNSAYQPVIAGRSSSAWGGRRRKQLPSPSWRYL